MSLDSPADSTWDKNSLDNPPSIWLNQVRAFAGRSLREVVNSWMLLGTAIGLPATMYLIPFIGGGEFPPVSRATMSIGTGIFGAMLTCLYVFGNLFVIDIEDRRYAAYRAMPISPSADLAGRMSAALVVAAAAFLSPLIVGVLTGASYRLQGGESIPIILAAGVLSCVFWMVLAIPIVVIAENERYAEWATTSVAIAAVVLTGFNGVTTDISLIKGTTLNYLPNTLPTRLIAYHLVEGDVAAAGLIPPQLPAAPEYLLILLAYAAVAVAFGTLVLNKLLYYKKGWL